MNHQAFLDGCAVGKRRGGDIDKLKKAVADCENMGWEYLKAYFLGQIEGVKDGEKPDSAGNG